VLSAGEVDQYRSKGYLVVEQVLSGAQVTALRQAADEWVEASRAVKDNGDVFDLEPGHGPEHPQVRRIKNPASIHQAYDAVMRSGQVLEVVAQLIGPNIRYQSTKLNMKSAGVGSAVEWHQDWAFYPHTNDDVLAVGVAIDDMNLDNGCLMVMSGSHCGPVLDHHCAGRFVGSVDPSLIDPAGCTPLEAHAGAITIHHVRLLHGSAPNISGRPRRLFLIEYVAGDSWPLLGSDWQSLQQHQLRGLTGPVPRMESIPVRLPLPPSERSGSIYEVQASEPRRTSFARG
jgi:ectoine hydroxylase-related dioxygenase (phytanoyl-CoA dioxygenase family)